MAEALHTRIAREIEARILARDWPPGHRIPFERELMEQHACSRMTVNKALSALAARGLITRRRRAGSVVAQPPAETALLEIEDLAARAALSGRAYAHRVLARRVAPASAAQAERLGIARREPLLHLTTLHVTDDVPDALERRVISLATVPEAEAERFADAPPGTWLLRRVPWSAAEHAVEATAADTALARHLGLEAGAPCLVLERRTWNGARLVTAARIAYPGARHRLVGRFSPRG